MTYSFDSKLKHRTSSTSSTSLDTLASPDELKSSTTKNFKSEGSNLVGLCSEQMEQLDECGNVIERSSESEQKKSLDEYGNIKETMNEGGWTKNVSSDVLSQNGCKEHTPKRNYENNYTNGIPVVASVPKFTSSLHVSSFGLPYTARLLGKSTPTNSRTCQQHPGVQVQTQVFNDSGNMEVSSPSSKTCSNKSDSESHIDSQKSKLAVSIQSPGTDICIKKQWSQASISSHQSAMLVTPTESKYFVDRLNSEIPGQTSNTDVSIDSLRSESSLQAPDSEVTNGGLNSEILLQTTSSEAPISGLKSVIPIQSTEPDISVGRSDSDIPVQTQVFELPVNAPIPDTCTSPLSDLPSKNNSTDIVISRHRNNLENTMVCSEMTSVLNDVSYCPQYNHDLRCPGSEIDTEVEAIDCECDKGDRLNMSECTSVLGVAVECGCAGFDNHNMTESNTLVTIMDDIQHRIINVCKEENISERGIKKGESIFINKVSVKPEIIELNDNCLNSNGNSVNSMTTESSSVTKHLDLMDNEIDSASIDNNSAKVGDVCETSNEMDENSCNITENVKADLDKSSFDNVESLNDYISSTNLDKDIVKSSIGPIAVKVDSSDSSETLNDPVRPDDQSSCHITLNTYEQIVCNNDLLDSNQLTEQPLTNNGNGREQVTSGETMLPSDNSASVGGDGMPGIAENVNEEMSQEEILQGRVCVLIF